MTSVLQQPFYYLDHPFIHDLSQQFQSIQTEFNQAVEESAYIQWPETFLYNEGWNIFGLRYQGQDFAVAHQMCPVLSSFIQQYSTLIDTAGFSILNPGTIIRPHVGYTAAVLRCHMGIKVPAGDCRLKVGGVEESWTEGGVIVFDDTLLHEAWNKTNETRIVLLMDLNKEALLLPEKI